MTDVIDLQAAFDRAMAAFTDEERSALGLWILSNEARKILPALCVNGPSEVCRHRVPCFVDAVRRSMSRDAGGTLRIIDDASRTGDKFFIEAP
jgi:hypothetical protein